MWLGTTQFLHGDIQEPMFLGQDYGTMLESVFASPLVFLGIPHNIALPISASILSLAPFFIPATILIKEKQYNKCFGIILVLLCMSVDVDILNSIPRSFGPGYAFITIGIIMMFYYDDWEIILGSFISGLGVVLSNTGICIFLPFFVIFVISKIKQLKRIFFSFLGGIPAIVINQLFVNFYIQNSEYKVWGQQGMIFENDKFVERVTSSINDYFKDMFFIRNGWIYIFLMILLAIIILYMGNGRKKYYFCTTIILTLLGSLYLVGYKKFSFLDDTPLWSVSRMMLFIPVNIALSFFLFLPDSYKRVGFKPMVVLPFAVVFLVFSLVFKWSDFQRRKNTLTSSSFHYIPNPRK